MGAPKLSRAGHPPPGTAESLVRCSQILETRQKEVQSEGGALDWGSII